MKKIYKYIGLLLITLTLTRCELDVIPQDALTSDQITTTSDGLSSLVNGLYAIFMKADGNNCYIRQYYQLTDFASDDIVCAYKTEDDLINGFRYKDRSAEKSNINSFWEMSYKVVYGANVAISMADLKGDDPFTNQLKGESYFLRAFATHNLVRLFAKPYSVANKSQPGVIIREDKADNMPKARASLEDTYKYIISSLKTAESLMFELETPGSFPDYFASAKTGSESIWIIPFSLVDDQLNGSVASMIYNGNNCWAEEGASASILADMGYGTKMVNIDQRWKYIVTDAPIVKNGVNMFYISKFSGQDGSSTLSSPVMFRLAEIYLNRAEAYAKKADVANAVADLNTLLENRLIVPDGENMDNYLFDSGMAGNKIVDAVLKERRIELAFEGHRIFDLLRNGKDVVRNYWGFHLDNFNGVPAGSEPGLSTPGVLFKANDPNLIYPIPSSEITTNKLCQPNS